MIKGVKVFQKLILYSFLKINIIFGTLISTDKIVAIVNHDIILNSDIENKINIIKYDTYNQNFYTYQNTQLYYTALDKLITDHLILQIAEKEKIKIDLNQLDQIIKHEAYIRNMTINQFYTYLDKIGLNKKKYCLEIYRNTLKKIICNQIIYQYQHVSPHEIIKIIQNLNTIDFNKQFKGIHIIIELPIQASPSIIYQTEEYAKSLIKEYKKYNNLQNIDHFYNNKNLFSKITHYKIDWITWEYMPIIFDKYLNSAKPGDIIGPIYSYDGMHIFKIEDIYTKKHTIPLIKVKIHDLISRNKSNDIYIKQQLLNIKSQIEHEKSTFSTVLQEKHKDFYSENYGNFLKWINLSQFELSIQNTLLSLKKNQISAPIYTNNGWCLIKLLDINKLNYSEILYERAYLHFLNQNYNSTLHQWIQELKSKSYIKIIN